MTNQSSINPITVRKIWDLLTSVARCSAVVLLGLMFIGMVLETLGIGLVIPALALMTQGDLGTKYPVLAPWLNSFGNPSHERLVIAGMLTLVGVHAVKVLFLGTDGDGYHRKLQLRPHHSAGCPPAHHRAALRHHR